MPSGNTTMSSNQLLWNPTAHKLNKSQHKHLEGPLLSTNIIKCAWLYGHILSEGSHYYLGNEFILQGPKSHQLKGLGQNVFLKENLP